MTVLWKNRPELCSNGKNVHEPSLVFVDVRYFLVDFRILHCLLPLFLVRRYIHFWAHPCNSLLEGYCERRGSFPNEDYVTNTKLSSTKWSNDIQILIQTRNFPTCVGDGHHCHQGRYTTDHTHFGSVTQTALCWRGTRNKPVCAWQKEHLQRAVCFGLWCCLPWWWWISATETCRNIAWLYKYVHSFGPVCRQ
jgi:hypothetical protein